MAKIPAETKKLLDALKEGLAQILGRDLFGIYIYGSLTYNAFNPRTSDVDVVVVLDKDLNKSQILKLKRLHKLMSSLGKRGDELEIDYVNRNKFFKPGFVYELYGKKFKKVKYKNIFKAIMWWNIKTSGITLFGPSPKKWLPKISKDQIHRELRRELNFNRKYINKGSKLLLWEQVYSTLTLCRLLYNHQKHTIPSKEQAGRWALKNLDKKWHSIIKLALKYRPVRTKRASIPILTKMLPKFADYVKKEITGN